MYTALPVIVILCVYILAAVLPAYFLMRYIYRMDSAEKEPPMLLMSLVIMGVFAALAAIVLEYVGQFILGFVLDSSSAAYVIALAFLVVAAAEEGTKLLFLKLRTWKDKNFNYRFDGIVYSVFVSLGFAAFENIKYVLGYGLSVAVPRALLAVPGHMGFAVFMGVFYGRAKVCEQRNDRAGKTFNLIAGYVVAVMLHGFYDSCAMIGNTLSTLLFIVFVAVMYFAVIRTVKHQSLSDREIGPS